MSPVSPGLSVKPSGPAEGFSGPRPFQGSRSQDPRNTSGVAAPVRQGGGTRPGWAPVPGDRFWGISRGGGSFLREDFFSSPMSPVIFLEPGLGLEGGQTLAGVVVGFPPCQVNPSELGSHEPLSLGVQTAASHPSREGGVCRTLRSAPLCPPT